MDDAKLLGVRQMDGTISILPKPLTLSKDFLNLCLDKNIKPTEHFRFVGNCAESGCMQWKDSKCSIASNAVEIVKKMLDTMEKLPVCNIRSNCRWYDQEKSNACNACKYIVTEVSENNFQDE